MSGSRAFHLALLISLTAHSAVLVPWPVLNSINEKSEIEQKKPVEVSYLDITVIPQPAAGVRPRPKNVRSLQVVQEASPPVRTATPQPREKTAISRQSKGDLTVAKANPLEAESEAQKKSAVSVQRKIAYMDYYDIIRERIRYALFKMYSGGYNKGQVHLQFTLGSDGSLRGAGILEAKSMESKELKNLTLRALKKSLPFPPFPAELNDPEINFTVVISYHQ